MSLRIYNTLHGKKEAFVPLEEGKVGMYVCGPTVYDHCHMGHARATIVFDVVFRYLKYKGYHVTYVRNITDIDDKIIMRSKEEGVDFSEITARYIRSFHDDMLELGNEPPTHEPKATDHLDGIIAMIERLVEKGYAYQVEGDVYYAVRSFDDYGKLSGRKTDDLLSGVRIEVDERKKDPLDFALWKASKEGEPWWDSPFGKGRPGWHIECSTMSSSLLGETFDIHGGGKDLIFPHHENEVAQSEGAHDKPFARYWMHNGFVNVNKEKMSKSLDNFFTIRELLGLYHPVVLRFFLLTTHYRSPIDYSDQNLKEAEKALGKLYGTLSAINLLAETDKTVIGGEHLREGEGIEADVELTVGTLKERFAEAMDDDFNTALAIAALFDAVRDVNRWINDPGFVPNSLTCGVLNQAACTLKEVGEVLGLLQLEPGEFLSLMQEKRSVDLKIDMEDVEQLIEEREEARRTRNWVRADEIRDNLAAVGVVLKDSEGKTAWEVKK